VDDTYFLFWFWCGEIIMNSSKNDLERIEEEITFLESIIFNDTLTHQDRVNKIRERVSEERRARRRFIQTGEKK
jgi:hypothetical protein